MTSLLGPRLPITPADSLLPLGEMLWQNFETFCEDYIRAVTGADHVPRYGVRGDPQQGIDFYAETAEGRISYQCKRVKSLTAADAQHIIARTTFGAAVRHVVLTSCEVGASVRDFFLRVPGWEIRDVRDISGDIAVSMPRDVAERLVDRHFGPHWKANFFPEGKSAASQEEALAGYRALVVAGTRDLAIPGLPRIGRRAPLQLESIYVTLRAAYTNRAAGSAGGPARAHSGSTPLWFQDGSAAGDARGSLSLTEAYRREPRLVILGDPGSGKTTALQWLALRLAQAGLDGTPNDLGPLRVPIFIRASAYLKAWHERGRSLPLSAYIGHHLTPEVDGALLNAALKAVLRRGEGVLLLDGLDEVADLKDRYDIAREVDRFLDDWLPHLEEGSSDRGNRAVITSRIVGYSSAELKTDAVLMTIEPLGSAAVEDLCRVLIPALRGGEPAESEAARMTTAVTRLRGAGYGDLVGTPLLVTILALVYHHRGGELPTRRLALYSLAIDVMVDRWTERARLRGGEEISPQDIRVLFADLAAEMLDRAVVRVSESDLEDFLLRRTNGQRSIGWLKELMRDDVGLLTAQGEGWFAFLHATFQEYLGGWSLTQEPSRAADRIWEKAAKPRWALAVVMAVGMCGQSSHLEWQRSFVEALLAHDAGKEGLLPAATLLLTAAIPEMDTPPPGVHEILARQLVEAYARNVLLNRPRAFAAVLEDAARLLVRWAGKRAIAETFHRALRISRPESLAAVAIAVARLTSAAQCETGTLAAALLASLRFDSEAWGWPMDATLREIADRAPALLPSDRNSLRAQLLANEALAEAFTGDAAWRRIGLTLYGGQDNGLPNRMDAAAAEVERLRTQLDVFDQTPSTPEREQRRQELSQRIDAADADWRALRDARATYSVRHFHRESPALTPRIVDALSEGRGAATLQNELEGLARSATDESVRVDARLALVALGNAGAEEWTDPASSEGRQTRAALRRVGLYIGIGIPTVLKSAAEGLRTADIPPSRTRDLISVVADLSHAFGSNLGLFNLPENDSSLLMWRWIAEALRLQLDPSRTDALYNMAVVLDTSGGNLSTPAMRLVLALAMAPFSMTARWGNRTQWSMDRLSPLPTSTRESLAFALDVTEAITNEFDFVRAWAIGCMAPLLQEHGLAGEALIQLWMTTSDRYGARTFAIAQLAASMNTGLQKENLFDLASGLDDPWLRFRCVTLLLRSAPGIRRVIGDGVLSETARAILDPTQRCRAFAALHAIEWPGGDWLSLGRAAADEIGNAENKAQAYATLARFSRGRSRDLVGEAWSVALQADPLMRPELLAGIREIATEEEIPFLPVGGLEEWECHVLAQRRRSLLAEYATLLEPAKVDTALLLLAATLADLGVSPEAPGELEQWWTVVGAEPEEASRIRSAPLSAAAADAIDTLLETGRVDLAARLLVVADRFDPPVERQLRIWLRSEDDRIRRHASLLLVEAGEYSAAAMKGTLELLESKLDRSRFRAALAIHGNFSDLRPAITTDQTGYAALEAVARDVDEGKAFEPGLALHVGWLFERVEHSDPQLFRQWVQTAQQDDRDGAAARFLIEEMQGIRLPVWSAYLAALKDINGRKTPQANRSLIRGLCHLLARGVVTAEMWREAWPIVAALDGQWLESDSFLLNAAGAVVDVAAALTAEGGAAPFGDAARELAGRHLSVVSEIGRLSGNPDALLRMLTDVGTLEIAGTVFRNEVSVAAQRVVLQPALLEILVRWLPEALSNTDRSYYGTETGDLLCVTAAAAEQLPDLFYGLALSMPDLHDHLARAARLYRSFPGRQAAFALMALTRHMSTETVRGLRTAMLDVVYVQQTALESLDRYQSADPSALDELLAALQDDSASFAYWCARLLNTIARNSKLDVRIRERVLATFTAALDDPASSRDVYVLTWNQKRNEDRALTIEYRGSLRDHLARWLGELGGVADLVRAALGGAA